MITQVLFGAISLGMAADYNQLIVERIENMPQGGVYGRYRQGLPESQRFDELYQTVEDLGRALQVELSGQLRVKPAKAARYSFCSSATYLLFCDVVSVAGLQRVLTKELSREMADVGDKVSVIHGKMDGVGIFGHWNANGPGTAVLFERLDLGTNFSSFDGATPGDFMKIFWNESIGKGESGHLVVYLGLNGAGDQVKVWSSNLLNDDDSQGYGTMWVKRERIKRVIFSRLERPENLAHWLNFSEAEKTSDYLVRILTTGSTEEEMKEVTRARN
ncbi:MAG: hypothetical protein CMO61_01635 [Verrucomicrobiales bacterium]|jgi:hypothetical protein|nr:hypothetical protein [Verrucomicrobiales bacterium]|tara:strand:+ start:6774 stop:7595 length:822 start_codon:yes stop_codon:yes gene_type:complete